jgi:asparagine synthase (glutamine-hydrolysing)
MCGFAGWIGRPDPDLLTRLSATLVHRGPDDHGRWSDDLVSLCHRRLAIVDLEGGRQPMSSESGRTVVAYNGELYNYRDLREDLRAEGYRFRTASDTEVLLAAYERWGVECLTRFNGMFALALYDRPARRVLLAVDRFGKKPLYFAPTPGGVAFASAIAALRRHPAISLTLDRQGLATYFLHGYLPAPGTIYDGVRKLEGGRFLVLQLDDPSMSSPSQTYWEPSFEPKLRLSRPDAVEGVRHFLRLAVQRRMNADVAVGATLSGGLDSSSVVAFMADASPGPLKSYALGFTDAAYDESSVARQVAAHFGTAHHQEIMDASAGLDTLPLAVAACDEPLADDSLVATFALCRFARRSVKVLLSGDGGDELFAGYDAFLADRLFQWFRRVPGPLARRAHAAGERLPLSVHRRFDYRVGEFLESRSLGPRERHQLWLGPCSPEDLNQLLTREARDSVRQPRHARDESGMAGSNANNELDRLIHVYFRSSLQNGILVKIDRAAMAHGLEMRSPFLDVDLVEFVNRLPSSWKQAGWRRKRLLRDAVRDRLPSVVLTRGKRGFAPPASAWLKGPLRPALQSALASDRLRREGLFQPAFVGRVVDEHLQGRWGHRRLLWALLVFQLWSDAATRADVACHA